jgi:hypothetical protein
VDPVSRGARGGKICLVTSLARSVLLRGWQVK